VIAIRPWELGLFTEFRQRKPDLRAVPTALPVGRPAR